MLSTHLVAMILWCSVGLGDSPRAERTQLPAPLWTDLDPHTLLDIYKLREKQLAAALVEARRANRDEDSHRLRLRLVQVIERRISLQWHYPRYGPGMPMITQDQLLELKGRPPAPKPPVRD